MPDPKPMNVYPDPDGGSNSNAYVPSNTATATGAAVSGAVSVAAAAPAVVGFITNVSAFLQGTGDRAQQMDPFLFFHSLKPGYVAIVVFFGSLSVLLQVINLAMGIRMKERLTKLSEQVCDLCEKAGLLSKKQAA